MVAQRSGVSCSACACASVDDKPVRLRADQNKSSQSIPSTFVLVSGTIVDARDCNRYLLEAFSLRELTEVTFLLSWSQRR